MELFVATQNPGKKREYQELLALLEAEIRFPDDLDLHLDVREDGTTYAQNARKKAKRYASASGLLTVADDSGLEVDALDGAPGVHSARYAAGSDADRVEALLEDLRGVPWEERTARFRCVLVIVTRADEVCEAEGVCEGVIAHEPRGEQGFGYDPIFYLPEHASTMAQLSRADKNRISHRARAVQKALPLLKRILQNDEERR
jgi:XTP/dITP diphosphohydrolase